MRNSLRLVLVAVSLLAALTLLEGAFRVSRYVVRGPDSRATVDDAELGWAHNIKRPVVTRRNSCGEDVVTRPAPSPYLIHAPRDRGGTRVLFLGDSSTHAHEVSTDAAYYDFVELTGQGRYSVWAAGAGGYGSLQEYLLLKKIYEEIAPDIVVWQLDSNDVANNVYRLDFGVVSNNVQPRPYLNPVSGAIERRSPALRILRVSEGARFLLSRVVGIDEKYTLGLIDGVESWMRPAAEELPGLTRRGLQVLEYVVAEATRRYPGTRFAGFSMSSEADEVYGDIFRRHGARYWPGVADRVSAGATRTDCSPLDGHWNHTGNRIAGETLAALLSEM